jgi:hypothetical protein
MSGVSRRLRPLVSGSHISRRPAHLAMLVLLALALQLAAGAGVAYLAGFSRTSAALSHFDWPYIVGVVGALAASLVGYYYAYCGIYGVEGGPTLRPQQMRAVVVAGFGGFLAHGGGALDKYAVEAGGATPREATVRVSSLAGMEHGILGLVGQGAGVALLLAGAHRPPLDFIVPWAVIPLPGFLVAFWLANRYRNRLSDQGRLRAKLAVFVASIFLIRQLFVKYREHWPALAGMAGFWLADMFAGWCGLAAFGFLMGPAQFIIGFGTGMVFTRRTGPLAGAGILGLVLPITVWYSGAPFGAAVAGLFAYRVLALWLPMPAALAALPTLRLMGERADGEAPGQPGPQGEPALERRSA